MDRRSFIGKSAVSGLAASLALPQSGLAAPEERVVVITGAGSGFGFRMAETYARNGFRVVATLRDGDERNQEKKRALESLTNSGLNVIVDELDVLDTESHKSFIEELVVREKHIDIWVNNAGILPFCPIETTPPKLWELVMGTNVIGPMNLASEVLPYMRERRSGLLIQISSRVGRVTLPGLGVYSTSKFALETATETFHYEAKNSDVDFAIIQPSAFDTDINRNAVALFQNVTLPLLTEQKPQAGAYYREFLEELVNGFSHQPTRNPQEVADKALEIALADRNERNLRYPVGDFSELQDVQNMNEFTSHIQRSALNMSGKGDWYRD